MRVLLKLRLDCDADAAWRAIRSPSVLREVVAPWLDFSSLEPGGLPTTWPVGTHRLQTLVFRRWPVGESFVDVSYPGGLPRGVRMLRDGGGTITRGRAGLRSWDHRMAISPLPDGRTLYRDRLLVSTGSPAADAALWYPAWSFWQWRGARLKALAPGWAFDPPGTADAAEHAGTEASEASWASGGPDASGADR
ncbi:hypothetical protein [Agromyces intestinalis]|uniref:hypothetical protein n=1 Tax=Agromyces intestinalis TaxID=2592652 RepID=UPI001AEF40DA|nr:hypothetical protein [Agromyces intestinalis]